MYDDKTKKVTAYMTKLHELPIGEEIHLQFENGDYALAEKKSETSRTIDFVSVTYGDLFRIYKKDSTCRRITSKKVSKMTANLIA